MLHCPNPRCLSIEIVRILHQIVNANPESTAPNTYAVNEYRCTTCGENFTEDVIVDDEFIDLDEYRERGAYDEEDYEPYESAADLIDSQIVSPVPMGRDNEIRR